MITIITNRKQIQYTDLVTHLKKCVHPNVSRIILREKDLPLETIIKKIQTIKGTPGLRDIPLFLNGPYDILQSFGADGRHFTIDQYKDYCLLPDKPNFLVGVSVHHVEEIELVDPTCASYMLYGHIFPTACKAGLQQRGLDNLKILMGKTQISFVGLGGITPTNYLSLYEKGCRNFAMMSSVMQAENPQSYLDVFKSQ